MIEYDAEKARIAAIATLTGKQQSIIAKVKAKYNTDEFMSFFTYDPIDLFNMACDQQREWRSSGDFLPAVKNWINIQEAAGCYVELEGLIKRLENGADARTILYEIVSNND